MQLHGDDLELSDAELSRKTHLSILILIYVFPYRDALCN